MKDKLLVVLGACILSVFLGFVVAVTSAWLFKTQVIHLAAGSFAVGLAVGFLARVERPYDIHVPILLLVPLCGIAGVLGWVIATHL